LTLPQKIWLISNINKDREEEIDILKYLCIHIRPEAYQDELGDKQESTEFLSDIEKMAGRKLSDEEKAKLEIKEQETTEIDIDVIERI
jgi:hypothetical protein